MASFVVILCHCNFFAVFSPEDELLHRFTTCLLADSVGMFWIISGFFFCEAKSYGRLWLGTLKKIIIPGVLAVLFTYFFTDPLINSIPFSESEALTPDALSGFFIRLFTFRETGIYWYVFAYILVVAVQPVISRITGWLDGSLVREVVFVVATLVILFLNDMSGNSILHFSYTGIFVLIPAMIEVIWGHIIFRHRNRLLSPVMIIPGLVTGLVSVIARSAYYSRCIETGAGSHIVSWFTSFGFISAAVAVLLCMQLVRGDASHDYDDMIRFLAGYTYPIYLIHPFLLTYARTRGFFDVIGRWLLQIFPSGVTSIFCVIIGFVTFYTISLLIAYLLRRITATLLAAFS